MNRTQIYLTDAELQGVARIAADSGRNNSEIIREAIDLYLERLSPQDKLSRLRMAKGIWSSRDGDGATDLAQIRSDFERF